MKKTNAIRILERHKINYLTHEYKVDEDDLSATHVAESVGQDVKRVFKTLVLEGDKSGHIVAIIPGDAEVDLKKLAQASKNKKCQMIAMKDILKVTGYIRGGCSPFGMKKQFPTFIDQTATSFPTIFVSPGVRGMQIEINPQDLIKTVSATSVDLTQPD